MEDILVQVLQRITPSEEERTFVEELTKELRGIAESVIEEAGLSVIPRFVGSLAKDTYLAGDHDVDLFLAFPLETPIEELRREGLKLGEEIGKRLDGYEVAYAEHPYVRARYRGVSVDLVPCYDVRSWRDVRTAVDRSILHTRWVNDNLNGRNNEVRLLKRFLKGIGAYGSEIYVRGFSGYLAEILTIEYGSFVEVLNQAGRILKRRVLDPAGWTEKEPAVAMKTVKREVREDKPLIVIDPVDPRRNVSANLSWEKYGAFYLRSREFLERPAVRFFFPQGKSIGSYLEELRKRGTALVTLLFDVQDIVDDLLLPQLERSARGFEKALGREGFEVLGWNVGRRGRAFIMLELNRAERERIRLKPGPEFFKESGQEFYGKNEKVWIVGKRLYSERTISESVIDVVSELLRKNQVALGKGIRDAVRRADVLLNYVPKELEDEAYLLLSREKWNLKG
ncbi:MAG: CCA tRNA nucleotidyltransferase [Thermococci archaeon]|nr:CCA tRNA nucleotidyltransferase [Thermococci archaeon]